MRNRLLMIFALVFLIVSLFTSGAEEEPYFQIGEGSDYERDAATGKITIKSGHIDLVNYDKEVELLEGATGTINGKNVRGPCDIKPNLITLKGGNAFYEHEHGAVTGYATVTPNKISLTQGGKFQISAEEFYEGQVDILTDELGYKANIINGKVNGIPATNLNDVYYSEGLIYGTSREGHQATFDLGVKIGTPGQESVFAYNKAENELNLLSGIGEMPVNPEGKVTVNMDVKVGDEAEGLKVSDTIVNKGAIMFKRGTMSVPASPGLAAETTINNVLISGNRDAAICSRNLKCTDSEMQVLLNDAGLVAHNLQGPESVLKITPGPESGYDLKDLAVMISGGSTDDVSLLKTEPATLVANSETMVELSDEDEEYILVTQLTPEEVELIAQTERFKNDLDIEYTTDKGRQQLVMMREDGSLIGQSCQVAATPTAEAIATGLAGGRASGCENYCEGGVNTKVDEQEKMEKYARDVWRKEHPNQPEIPPTEIIEIFKEKIIRRSDISLPEDADAKDYDTKITMDKKGDRWLMLGYDERGESKYFPINLDMNSYRIGDIETSSVFYGYTGCGENEDCDYKARGRVRVDVSEGRTIYEWDEREIIISSKENFFTIDISEPKPELLASIEKARREAVAELPQED